MLRDRSAHQGLSNLRICDSRDCRPDYLGTQGALHRRIWAEVGDPAERLPDHRLVETGESALGNGTLQCACGVACRGLLHCGQATAPLDSLNELVVPLAELG